MGAAIYRVGTPKGRASTVNRRLGMIFPEVVHIRQFAGTLIAGVRPIHMPLTDDYPELRRRDQTMTDWQIGAEQFLAGFRHLRNHSYLDRSVLMNARQRIITIVGAAQGSPVVAGVAAMVMHGCVWFEADFIIELIRGPSASGRPAAGTVTHRLELTDTEIVPIEGILVTTPMRTAFDVGRVRPRGRALANLDSLAAATGYDLNALDRLARSARRSRGLVQLRELVGLVDAKSESPAESSFRLFLHDAGLPTPQTQVEVYDDFGNFVARHDFAYSRYKVAIEYDGEEFHSSSAQLANDEARDGKSAALGWKVVRANAARMRADPMGIVNEVNRALTQRGAYYC